MILNRSKSQADRVKEALCDRVNNFNPSQPRDGRGRFGSGGGGGSGGASTELSRSKDIPYLSPQWKGEMDRADQMALEGLNKSISGVNVYKISGEYVHEPRVEGYTEKSLSVIKKELSSSGYSAPSKFNKQENQTFVHKETKHQISVGKMIEKNGRHVSYFPQYPLEQFNLD